MRIDEVVKLDWKQDKQLLAVEGKVADLVKREKQVRARLEELDQIVHEDEAALIQCRAAMLLDEQPSESEDLVQHRLSSSRQEKAELHASLEALTLAQKKLEPIIAATASEARSRIAELLIGPYQETTGALEDLLEQAARLNKILHSIHQLCAKQNLRTEMFGNPRLKPLGLLAAWNYLTIPEGQDSLEFTTWKKYTATIFGRN